MACALLENDEHVVISDLKNFTFKQLNIQTWCLVQPLSLATRVVVEMFSTDDRKAAIIYILYNAECVVSPACYVVASLKCCLLSFFSCLLSAINNFGQKIAVD